MVRKNQFQKSPVTKLLFGRDPPLVGLPRRRMQALTLRFREMKFPCLTKESSIPRQMRAKLRKIAIGSTRVQDPRVKLPESLVGGKAPATTTTVLGQDAFLQSNTAELPPIIARINLSGESASLACTMYGTPVTCLLDSGATHSLISDQQVRKIERITGVKRTGSSVRIDGLIWKSKISSWHLRCQSEIRNKQGSSDVSYHR